MGACGGIEKTLEYIQRHFSWNGMTRDVKKFVGECDQCARNKSSTNIMRESIQPLTIPEEKWTCLSMDFMTDLPKAITGEDAIFVVVDRLTKQAHFIPCRGGITAKETAILFIKEVWKLHGLPTSIVSDRDPRFVSSFWAELTTALKIKRALSTAYHPETDGQTERTNRTIEQILRFFCADQQQRWIEFLPMAEFAYNNAKHTSTGISPFNTNLGIHPRADFPSMQAVNNEAAVQCVVRMKKIQERLKGMVAMAQQRQQQFANRHRKEREFNEGDWVYLASAHLNVQMLTRKLAPKYLGLLRILEKISKTAYRLDIPPYWRIHGVFYIGLLKERKKPPKSEPKLPLLTHEADEFEVEEIRNHRQAREGMKFLVKWRGYSEDENTWQSAADLANAPRILSEYCRRVGINRVDYQV